MGVINYRIAIPRTGGSREIRITDFFEVIVETRQTFKFDGITITVTPNYANDSFFYVKVEGADGWLDSNNYRHEFMVVQGTEGSFTLDLKICEMFSIEEGTTLAVNRIVDGEFLFGVDFNGDNSCDGGSVTYTPASGSNYLECYIDDCCMWHIKPITESNIPVKTTITHTSNDITSVLELNVWCWGYDTTIDFDNDYFSISTSKNVVTALCEGTLPFSSRDIGATINDEQPVGGFYDKQASWEIIGFDDFNSDVLIKANHDINECLYPEVYKMVCEDKTLHYSISSIYPDVKITDDLITFPYGGGTRTFKIYDTEHTFADVPSNLGYSITYVGVDEDDVHTFTAVSDGTPSTVPVKINIGGDNFAMYVPMYTAPDESVVPLSGFPVLVGDDDTAVDINYTSSSALDMLNNPLGFSILTSTSSSTTLKTENDWGIRPLFNGVQGNNFTYWVIKNGAGITPDETEIDYYCIDETVYVHYHRCTPAGFSTTGDITVEISWQYEDFDTTTIVYKITDIGKEWREDYKYYLNVYTENGYSKQIELVRAAPECSIGLFNPSFNALHPETKSGTITGNYMKTINTPVLMKPWKGLSMVVGETTEDDEFWMKSKEIQFTTGFYFSEDQPEAYVYVDGVGYDGKTYSATDDFYITRADENPELMGADETSPTFMPIGYYVKTPTCSAEDWTDDYYIDNPVITVNLIQPKPNVYSGRAEIHATALGETALNWYIYARTGYRNAWSTVNFKVTDGKPSYEGPSSIEVAQYETRTVDIVLRNINYAYCYILGGGNLETEQQIMGNDLFIKAKISLDEDAELNISTDLYDSSSSVELTYSIPLKYTEQPSRITPETTELEVSAGYTSGSLSVEYYACSTPNTPTSPSWVNLNVLSDSSSGLTRTVVYGYEIESNSINNGVGRNGKIVFSAPQLDDGQVSAVVTITQLEDTSKMASIAIYTTDLNFTAKGGTKYVQVDYTNAATIDAPSSDSWITITESSRNTVTSGVNTITQVQYKIVAASATTSRTTNITFSCVGGDGVKVSSSRTLVYQEAPTAEITPLDKYTNFRSDGGYDYVEFMTINPNSEGLVVSTESPYITTVRVNNSETVEDVTIYSVYIEGDVEYTGNTKLTQYVKVSYTTTGGDYAEILYPVYIYPSTWGEIKPYNEILRLKADGTPEMSYTTLGCGYSSMSVIDTPMPDVDWFTVTGEYTTDTGASVYDEVRRWAYTATPNTGSERRGYISYTGIDENGNTITAMSTVIQAKADDYEEPSDPDTPDLPSNSYDTTVAPIWQDCEYIWASQESVVFTLSTEVAEYTDFGVEYTERTIYKGKAWRKPDDDRIRVMINKICQNYFDEAYLPLDSTTIGVNGGYRKFYLKSEAGTLLHTYYFVNDWSYKTLKLGLKTNPIIPNIVDGQRLFFSAFAHDEPMGFEWGMTYYDGTPNYSNMEMVKNNLSTVIVPPSRSEGVKTFSFGNRSYQMIPRCAARYVLYYLNPYGGWDWFPVMGTVKRSDNLTQYSYTRNYNNTTLDFGKTRYLSEINVRYAMNTGWLSQAQSDRMWELMESNSVYMHDLSTDEIRPMVITDTQVEHKQKNRSQKIIQYTINIEESQTRERM